MLQYPLINNLSKFESIPKDDEDFQESFRSQGRHTTPRARQTKSNLQTNRLVAQGTSDQQTSYHLFSPVSSRYKSYVLS